MANDDAEHLSMHLGSFVFHVLEKEKKKRESFLALSVEDVMSVFLG